MGKSLGECKNILNAHCETKLKIIEKNNDIKLMYENAGFTGKQLNHLIVNDYQYEQENNDNGDNDRLCWENVKLSTIEKLQKILNDFSIIDREHYDKKEDKIYNYRSIKYKESIIYKYVHSGCGFNDKLVLKNKSNEVLLYTYMDKIETMVVKNSDLLLEEMNNLGLKNISTNDYTQFLFMLSPVHYEIEHCHVVEK